MRRDYQPNGDGLCNKALLAQDKDEALVTADMACFTMPGFDGQAWSVVAICDPASGKFKTLTLTRAGEWIDASVLPAW